MCFLLNALEVAVLYASCITDAILGDERPCQRCIKRGLQDVCQDGVRKKAKYLHDAPNEALLPGMGVRNGGSNHFPYIPNLGRGQNLQTTAGYPGPVTYASQQSPASSFPPFSSNGQQIQLPPHLSGGIMEPHTYSTQQSPITPQFTTNSSSQSSPMQNLGGSLQHPQQAPPTLQTSFTGLSYDTNGSSQYNFDPASFNFGNHYGALEFGILGHMSSNAVETPSSDATVHLGQGSNASYATPGTRSAGFCDSPGTGQGYVYPQDPNLREWRSDVPTNVRGSSAAHPYGLAQGHDSAETLKQEAPPAFAIGVVPSAFTSPETTPSSQGVVTNYDDNSGATAMYATEIGRQGTVSRTSQQRPSQKISPSGLQASAVPARRPRDSSAIYESVKQPYSYTSGFHGLTNFLQKRFSPQRTLRIAKALASIRPSFISCTKTLNREDLIFMEKCFQRTLWEYEEFINACGTPTIVCRRTGEVAAVGKEFTIMTGWTKEVLLGQEPNLNINTGGSSGQPGTGASSRGGFNTPRVPDEARPQPVFLAELLDDDSAIEFYEDFARLAFGDPRGSVTTQCKLLKYKTANDPSFSNEAESAFDGDVDSRFNMKRRMAGRGGGGEARITDLGMKEGKVECSYCWTVKRDVFDIPMLIVMNVRDDA